MTLDYYKHQNILIENYKAIYFFVPKVACTSLKLFCADLLNLPEQKEWTVHTEVAFPYVKVDSLNEYEDYSKFAFVRNPLDRIRSFYINKVCAQQPRLELEKYGENYFYRNMPFEEFIPKICSIGDSEADSHFMQQSSILSDSNGNLLPDYLFKMEDIDLNMRNLSSLLGFDKEIRLSRVNYSKKSVVDRISFTNELVDIVGERYSKDFELFNYELKKK